MDQFQNNQGQQFNGGQQVNNFNQGQQFNVGNQNAPEFTLWLVLGIVQICLICCCNLLTCVCGILTVIFISNANNFYKLGQMVEYQAKVKSAKIANLVGWGLIVVSIIFNIFAGVFDQLQSTMGI